MYLFLLATERANGPPVNATVGLPAPRTGTSVVAKLEEPSQTKNGTAARSRRNSSRAFNASYNPVIYAAANQ
ncbi:Hypp7064 [Branchiostoma lanceolatum]|uniref:Hypp7064 protein n=1 Tax=Branchiostoma lanceolatum TaxID=7740 RepID=A0A8K0E8T8_BRALA|nr:Hypp7064 [Branchiostoma lanceolatum]